MATQAKGGNGTTNGFVGGGLATHLVLLCPVGDGDNFRRSEASDATIECLDEKFSKEIR